MNKDRRDFLKQAAHLAALAALGPLVSAGCEKSGGGSGGGGGNSQQISVGASTRAQASVQVDSGFSQFGGDFFRHVNNISGSLKYEVTGEGFQAQAADNAFTHQGNSFYWYVEGQKSSTLTPFTA